MKKTTSKLFVIGLVLFLAGLVICTAAYAALGFDFRNLDNHEYHDVTYTAEGAFTGIEIDETVADVYLLRAEDDVFRVECFEPAEEPHTVKIADGTLRIMAYERENWWLRFLDFRFRTTTVKVYLPEEIFDAVATIVIDNDTGDVVLAEGFHLSSLEIENDTGDTKLSGADISGSAHLKASTGSITAKNVTATQLSAKVSTGSITLENVTLAENLSAEAQTGNIRLLGVSAPAGVNVKTSTGSSTLTDISCGSVNAIASTGSITLNGINCGNIDLKADTGRISLTDVDAQGILTAKTSTGSIKFDSVGAFEMHIKSDTGSVTGSVRGQMYYDAKSDTGHVEVPNTRTGGLCEIKTDTGSIKITQQ